MNNLQKSVVDISQYIIRNTIQKFPNLENYSRKMLQCNFLGGNCVGEIRTDIGQINSVLVTRRLFRQWSQYMLGHKVKVIQRLTKSKFMSLFRLEQSWAHERLSFGAI